MPAVEPVYSLIQTVAFCSPVSAMLLNTSLSTSPDSFIGEHSTPNYEPHSVQEPVNTWDPSRYTETTGRLGILSPRVQVATAASAMQYSIV